MKMTNLNSLLLIIIGYFLVYVAPTYTSIWMFFGWSEANRFTALVSLLGASISGYLRVSKKNNGTLSKSDNQIYGKFIFSGIAIILIPIIVILAVEQAKENKRIAAYHLAQEDKKILENKLAEEARLKQMTKKSHSAPNCTELKRRYTQTAMRAFNGEYINPSDDFSLPSGCR